MPAQSRQTEKPKPVGTRPVLVGGWAGVGAGLRVLVNGFQEAGWWGWVGGMRAPDLLLRLRMLNHAGGVPGGCSRPTVLGLR